MIEQLLVSVLALQAAAVSGSVVLDDGSDPELWAAQPSEGVVLQVGRDGDALRFDFDFGGGGGWAAASRALPLELPERFALRLVLRGNAPPNTLEVKLVEAGANGDTVWWARRPAFSPPDQWTPLELKRRHFEFAWGPDGPRPLARVSRLEIAVVAGEGGSGSLWIDDISLLPLRPPPASHWPPRFRVSSGDGLAALDGDPTTCWSAPSGEAWMELSFTGALELGGLELAWGESRHAVDFTVEGVMDPSGWVLLGQLRGGNGGIDWLHLPDAEASALRLSFTAGASADGLSLCELQLLPPELGSDPNQLFARVASNVPRGRFPRFLAGEQSYWTVVGVDGGEGEVLVGEDGAVESVDRSFSIEPFLVIDGELVTWADVETEQQLVGGDLPIPVVTWRKAGLGLELTVVAEDARGEQRVFLRYRLTNSRETAATVRLALAVRPFQVNPRWQFLGRPGGVGSLRAIEASDEGWVMVGGKPAAAFLTRPLAFGATSFAAGEIVEHLAAGDLPRVTRVEDPAGWASAAAVFDLVLPPRGYNDVYAALPLGPSLAVPPQWVAEPETAFDAALRIAVDSWRRRLGRVQLELPAEAGELAETLRANLAYILINRDGPALQPGSRSYDRSWIRDGALTSTALLRLGVADAAVAFVEWFARYQFPSGRVPCCVDERGADPVPEHDSHGEFAYLAAEVVRHTGDLELARRLWPHVSAATAMLDALRAERRTMAEESPHRLRFWGLLPESISHEGYSSRPVHSYWDSFWGVRGLEDGSWLAGRLGRDAEARRLAAAALEMRREVMASVARVMVEEGIDFVPGSADLADFDPTSTSVVLDPLGLAPWLPKGALSATFDRYLAELEQRGDELRRTAVYTPYELRSVGVLVRLGRRDEAWGLLRPLLADRRPAGWRQWAEVVDPDPRSPRFLGDMPHTWVGSDFIRSFLDMLAFEEDGRLVLCAGIPREWTRPGERVRVAGLVTSFGELAYSLRGEQGRILVDIEALERLPAGGVLVRLPGLGDRTRALVDGREVAVSGSGIVIERLPAALVIAE